MFLEEDVRRQKDCSDALALGDKVLLREPEPVEDCLEVTNVCGVAAALERREQSELYVVQLFALLIQPEKPLAHLRNLGLVVLPLHQCLREFAQEPLHRSCAAQQCALKECAVVIVIVITAVVGTGASCLELELVADVGRRAQRLWGHVEEVDLCKTLSCRKFGGQDVHNCCSPRGRLCLEYPAHGLERPDGSSTLLPDPLAPCYSRIVG